MLNMIYLICDLYFFYSYIYIVFMCMMMGGLGVVVVVGGQTICMPLIKCVIV